MKKEYDLSKLKSRENPYASRLKKPVTLNHQENVLDYCTGMAEESCASADVTDELTAVAKQLLSLAEDLYGQRATPKWTFVGVEINDQPPHLAYYPEHGGVTISLSTKVLNNVDQCIFQLAHEVGHLLYPTADRRTSMVPPTITINEGVSTHFSLIALQMFRGEDAYRNAYESLR